MEWFYLILAGLTEILWATSMKYADGFTRLLPSIVTIVGYIFSAVFLSLALRKLPLGTAYAIWTGFGILGTSLLGILLFQEVLSLPKVICVCLILIGIIGLRVLT